MANYSNTCILGHVFGEVKVMFVVMLTIWRGDIKRLFKFALSICQWPFNLAVGCFYLFYSVSFCTVVSCIMFFYVFCVLICLLHSLSHELIIALCV